MLKLLLVISTLLLSIAIYAQKTRTIHSVDGISGATKEWNSQVNLQNIVVDDSQSTAIVYPFNGTVFPADISASSFMWKSSNPSVKSWNLSFETEGQSIHKTTDTTYFKPDVDLWEKLKDVSQQEPIIFSIESVDKKESASIKIQFSKDSVLAPIFYRAVRLPFRHADKNRDKLEWYLGDVSINRKRKMLDNMPVCANCHSFSQDGSTFAMDVDYANDKGNYSITPVDKKSTITVDNIISWTDYKRDNNVRTFGLLAKLSPDGKHAISTVKDRSIFVPVDNNFWYSQLFFPVKGVLVSYDVETGKFKSLKGADNPEFVQSSADWEPHNKEIIFSRAKCSVDTTLDKSTSVVLDLKYAADYVNKKKDFKYDLCRIPWNNSDGGDAILVDGASNNNKSNYFARYSPDGKWVVFCQAENFMLLQPDSKLYIMPAKGGKPRLMNCNRDEMNSWHSFSPNGKWMVFSSKHFGAYTQLFLTHIDENGNDTPPVWLEQLTVDKKAANIPEFVNIDYNEWLGIEDGFTDHATYINDIVSVSIDKKNYEPALKLAEGVIRKDPENYYGYYTRARINIAKASFDKSKPIDHKQIRSDITKSITILNDRIKEGDTNTETYSFLGASYFLIRQFDKALINCKLALEKNPDDVFTWKTLAALYSGKADFENTIKSNFKLYELTGQSDYLLRCAQIKFVRKLYTEAIADASIALTAEKCDVWALEILGNCYLALGDKLKAENYYSDMINCRPTDGKNYISRSKFYLSQKDYEKAIADLSKCLEFEELNLSVLLMRAMAYEEINEIDSALKDLNQLVGRVNNSDVYFLLARCYLKKQDFSNAVNNAEEAKKIIYSSKVSDNKSFKNLIDINRIIKECEIKLK